MRKVPARAPWGLIVGVVLVVAMFGTCVATCGDDDEDGMSIDPRCLLYHCDPASR